MGEDIHLRAFRPIFILMLLLHLRISWSATLPNENATATDSSPGLTSTPAGRSGPTVSVAIRLNTPSPVNNGNYGMTSGLNLTTVTTVRSSTEDTATQTPRPAASHPVTSAGAEHGQGTAADHTDGHTHHQGDNATDDGQHGNDTDHHDERFKVVSLDFAHVSVPYIICMWIVFASLAKIGFHLNNKLSSIFPESCLLILLGVIVGIALYFSNTEGYTLNADVFFLFLLPPIILDAGYFMPIRSFFDNIGTILLFAVIGTLMNTFMIGFSIYAFTRVGVGLIPFEMDVLHCLTFASLISAVDPVAVLAVFEEIHVNENLHICVFGESLLNDAVTVVLYHMFETFSEIGRDYITTIDIVAGVGSFFIVGIGGTLIGVIFGLVASFVTRFTDHVRVIEPVLVFVLGYLSYLTAEIFHLSGIMACTFCGITMKKYVEANISRKSHTTIKYFMKMLSSICETIIFMFLGLSTVTGDHSWDTAFVLLTLAFCLLYRAIAVIIQCFFANWIRANKLSKVDQFIMAYGGLRGAIAFSLVVLLDDKIFTKRQLMITTTLVVVYFTVFIQGTTIKPLVNALHVKKSDKHKPSMNEKIHERVIDHAMAGIEDIAGHFGHHDMRDRFQKFENKYIKPVLLGNSTMKHRGMSILRVFESLNQRDASEYIAKHGSFSALNSHFDRSDSFLNMYTAHVMSSQSMGSLDRSQDDLISSANTLSTSIPFDNGSSTVLDMQALDAQESRKMKDDSKIHHILDDAMFKIRKRFHKHERHMLPESASTNVFQHRVHQNLRKLISHSNRKHHHHHKDKREKRERDDDKPKKNVSFADLRRIDIIAGHARGVDPHTDASSDDEGITFTVAKATDGVGETESNPEATQDSPDNTITPTVAETTLPWKNFANRLEPLSSVSTLTINQPEDPCRGEAPLWVDNPGYMSVEIIKVICQSSPAMLVNGTSIPNNHNSPTSEDIAAVHMSRQTQLTQNAKMSNNSKIPKNCNLNKNMNNLFLTKAPIENDILRTKKIDDIHENDSVDGDEEAGDKRSSVIGVYVSSSEEDCSSDDAFAADLTFLPGNQVDCYLPATWRTNVDNDVNRKKEFVDDDRQGDTLDGAIKAPQGALPPPWKNSDTDDEAAQKSNVMFEIGDPTESLRPVPWDSMPNSMSMPPLPSDVEVDVFGDLDLDDIDKSSMKCLSDSEADEDCIPPPWRIASVAESSAPVRSPSASHELDSLVPQASQNSLRLSEAESRHSEQFRGHHHVIDIAPRDLEHSNSSGALSAMVDVEHDQLDLISRVELWLISNKPDQQDPVPEDEYEYAMYHDEIESNESGDVQDTYL